MFLFYGHYMFPEKKTPIIHAIRKSVVSGRHRFTKAKHKDAYAMFAKAMEEHHEWVVFLDDRGHENAPPELDVLIEKVFHHVATDDAFPLGSKSLASRANWVDPDLDWRKREVSCVRTGDSCFRTGDTCFRTGVYKSVRVIHAVVRVLHASTRVLTNPRAGVQIYRTGVILTLTLSHVNDDAVVRVFREKTTKKGKLQILGQIFLERLRVQINIVQNVLRGARYTPQRGTFGDLLPDPECWNNPDVQSPSGPTTDVSVLESIAAAAATAMDEWDSDKDEWVSSKSKA